MEEEDATFWDLEWIPYFLNILFYFWLHGLFIALPGFSLVVVCGLLIEMSSLAVEHRLWSATSVVVAHGLSCPETCGIFPDQGSNPWPLHCKVDCQPLDHQEVHDWTLSLWDLMLCPGPSCQDRVKIVELLAGVGELLGIGKTHTHLEPEVKYWSSRRSRSFLYISVCRKPQRVRTSERINLVKLQDTKSTDIRHISIHKQQIIWKEF